MTLGHSFLHILLVKSSWKDLLFMVNVFWSSWFCLNLLSIFNSWSIIGTQSWNWDICFARRKFFIWRTLKVRLMVQSFDRACHYVVSLLRKINLFFIMIRSSMIPVGWMNVFDRFFNFESLRKIIERRFNWRYWRIGSSAIEFNFLLISLIVGNIMKFWSLEVVFKVDGSISIMMFVGVIFGRRRNAWGRRSRFFHVSITVLLFDLSQSLAEVLISHEGIRNNNY